MPYCDVIDLPGGGTAIVRMSGRRPSLCDVCGNRPHIALCDAFVQPKRGTCDRKLCGDCRTQSGSHDFCPEHKELA